MTQNDQSKTQVETRRTKGWRILHGFIILHFLAEIAYCAYLVFIVLKPEGHSGPLGNQALNIPHDLMVTRRLYAIECWVATAGLAIYLAITEPRLRGAISAQVKEYD